MDESTEDQTKLNESLEDHEVSLQEDLNIYGFKDSSFLFTSDEILKEEQLLLEDKSFQENVVQTRSQFSRIPQKMLRP